jgi:hypothetical protein
MDVNEQVDLRRERVKEMMGAGGKHSKNHGHKGDEMAKKMRDHTNRNGMGS